ncbi:hypothetical protein D9M72_510650 [compost metagenome]
MDHAGVRERNQVHGGAGSGGLIHFHGGNPDVHGGQGHRIGTQPAAEIGHMLDPGGREPFCVPGGDVEAGCLLQPGGREDHLPGEFAEFGLGLGPQPGLGEDGGHQCGGVAGLPERLVEPERVVLPVGPQRRQQLPAFAGQERGDQVLQCVSHVIKPNRGALHPRCG